MHGRDQLTTDQLPRPEDLEKIYVVLLLLGPAYLGPPQTPAEQALMQSHIRFVLNLQQRGQAVAAGPILPGGEPGDLVGMTLLRAASIEKAIAITSADPGVQAGRFRIVVREWVIPPGQLPTRNEGAAV